MAELKNHIKLERFITIDSQSLERFEREGRRLGESGLPPSNATDLCKFESDEFNAVSLAWNSYENEYETEKKRLEDSIEEVENFISNILPDKESDAEAKCDAELSKLETEVGPNSAAYSNNSDLLDATAKDVAQVKKALGNRELQINFEKAYLPFMFALAFAEVWVNSKSFELFFASKQIISLLLASAVGAMLVFFAHITGTAIKRAVPEYMDGKRGKTILSMAALNSLVVIFILYLAKMRQAWVALDMEDDGPALSLDTDGLENALVEVDGLASLFGTELGSEGLFLLLFNVIVYVAGTAGGFIRHDSHPDYENLVKKESNHRNKQVAFKKRYEAGIAEAKKKKADLVSSFREQKGEKDTELKKLQRDLKTMEKNAVSIKRAVLKSTNDKLQAFRRANKAARSERAPSYFSSRIKFD